MYIMLRLCEHGMVDRIITLQWPASSVCILSLSIDCGSPFFVVKTTARSPTRKYTQIVDMPKDVQVEQATSHLTRPPNPDKTKLRMTSTCEQTKHSIHGKQNFLFMWCQETPHQANTNCAHRRKSATSANSSPWQYTYAPPPNQTRWKR